VDAGGVVGFCGEAGPATVAGAGVTVAGVGVVDFAGAVGAAGVTAAVGATTGSDGGCTACAGVAGATGGVGTTGVAALFCGGAEGRLAFRFRTPPPRLRMPPVMPGMTFCGGVDAVGSSVLSSAFNFGVIVLSGVGDSVGAASAVSTGVGASGSVGRDSGTTDVVGATGARGVSIIGGLTTGFGWAFGSDWTLVTSCDAGGMTGLGGAGAIPEDWGVGPDLRPVFTRSLRVST
jgi:hypothetical protein